MNRTIETLRRAVFWTACFALLLAVRLCHWKVLWVDEAYGLAAARRVLEGAALYRDVWFDKPPLYAWINLLWGAATGWPLRLGGALFALLCCWLAARVAGALFGVREGYFAAAAMAFFLSFDHPSALLSLAPDLLLIPFVLGAVWALATGRLALAAICAAVGLLANVKALALLPLILLWRPGAWKRGLPAFGATTAVVWLLAWGWLEPVWQWGALYSRLSFVANPLAEGLTRTTNWAGFHGALILLAALFFAGPDRQRWPLAAWLALSLGMVIMGLRFFPRYYFALLPVFVICAARGACLARRRWLIVVAAAALTVPAVRFGARHIATLREEPAAMRDLALWADCRDAAAIIRVNPGPADTLFVWGYRPELNVLAGLPGATRFLDSQPLTGVFADRHLTGAQPSAPLLAARHRRELANTHPTFIADGLGSLNPNLAITRYDDLRAWLAHYELVGETYGTRIYRRRSSVPLRATLR